MKKYYEKDYWNNDVIKYVYEKWEKFWNDTKKFKDKQSRFLLDKQSRFLVEQFLDDLIALDEDIYTD